MPVQLARELSRIESEGIRGLLPHRHEVPRLDQASSLIAQSVRAGPGPGLTGTRRLPSSIVVIGPSSVEGMVPSQALYTTEWSR